jgi:hypothetical protein
MSWPQSTVGNIASRFAIVGLALSTSACANGFGTDDSLQCGDVQAYRMQDGGCPVSEDTGLRWCQEGTESHWGIGEFCMKSPEGKIYIVRQTFGTELVNGEQWSLISIDAGADAAACEAAMQAYANCQTQN